MQKKVSKSRPKGKERQSIQIKVAARANRDVLAQPLRMVLGTYNFACVEYLYTEGMNAKVVESFGKIPFLHVSK